MSNSEEAKVEPTGDSMVPAVEHEESPPNGGPAVATGEPHEFGEEEYQEEYEEEYDGEGEMYDDDDYAVEITASESAEFGEGYEDQEADMLEDVRTKIREMEEEAEKLRQLQHTDGGSDNKTPRASLGQLGIPPVQTSDEKTEADARSVYVGQVDYSCTTEEVEAHFRSCGPIIRVTIICDKFTGHPKGYAYIEFANKESVDLAVALNDSTLKERQLKVVAKRTNTPGMGYARRTRRPYRGAGFSRSRRPAYRPYNPYYRGRSSRGGFRGGYRRPRARYMAY